ncbi:hypothetical protein BT96DRAFT_333084 [Gymnopus androsaceus JB14]|uniref:Uncharacterized protein n=1 Tax=Gymnopus androsaceus JB14 TaxID=1447944 RepID=A0A6A4GY03_9AGAR|nr:hypothetical protein BT96DRAFT_333084 [Gymnopus androsaceus JB14]
MIYQETPGILRVLMGFICDLTTVLECLFWLMHVHGEASEVDAKFVNLAVDAQGSSGARLRIHDTIRSFVTASFPFRIHQKDEALKIDNRAHSCSQVQTRRSGSA